MEKSFKRDIDSVAEVFNFLESFISFQGMSEPLAFRIKFAVEEIFTNMVKYNSQNVHDISIALERDGPNAIVRLVDFEEMPFDITRKEFDPSVPVEERKPGGLGIHLVKNIVDKLDYERVGNKSTTSLTIKLE